MKENFLQFQKLTQFNDLKHFISTRNGGLSKGVFASLNLSSKVGDVNESVLENMEIVSQFLLISPSQIVFPDQCHTPNCKVVRQNTTLEELQATDALISNEKNICLAVLSADCVPILLYDSVQRVIAAIHAGWKGTLNGIAKITVEEMFKTFGCLPENIVAAIGPSISWQHFEVGAEVSHAFAERFGQKPGIIHSNSHSGKDHIDLWEANRELLLQAGLSPSNIETNGLCTFSHPELFFSARRDGFGCGRFAAGIMLQEGIG